MIDLTLNPLSDLSSAMTDVHHVCPSFPSVLTSTDIHGWDTKKSTFSNRA